MREMPASFGGQYGATVMDPFGFMILMACIIYCFMCRRHLTLLPIIFIAAVLPQTLRIVLAGVDFSMIRLIVMFALIRVYMKGEHLSWRWLTGDKLMAAFIFFRTVIPTVLNANFGTFVQEAGNALDAFGTYYVARCTIRDLSNVVDIFKRFVPVVIVVAALHFYEFKYLHNVFSIFAGVGEHAWIRDGEVRARGAQSHAILAGCFWATFTPIFFSFILAFKKRRLLNICSILAIIAICIFSSSSTPMFSVLSCFFAWSMFKLKSHMRLIRWSVLFTLIGLHLVMSMPVWHLISRFSFSSSSTGYFRYLLIDSFIRRFNEWAILGTKFTGHWFFGAQDLTNQFVLVGVKGGLVTLLIFIAQIFVAFKSVGTILDVNKRDKIGTYLAWGLGASLFVHITNFFGVSYYGQIIILWYALFGIIASVEFYSVKALKASGAEKNLVPQTT